MGPALVSKSGSRGKIQLRLVHGRSASSANANQRQIVWFRRSAPPAPADDFGADVGNMQPREREPEFTREPARDGLDLDHQLHRGV